MDKCTRRHSQFFFRFAARAAEGTLVVTIQFLLLVNNTVLLFLAENLSPVFCKCSRRRCGSCTAPFFYPDIFLRVCKEITTLQNTFLAQFSSALEVQTFGE